MVNNKTNGLSRLISELSKLPGLGERSAERLTFHILKMPEQDRQNLAGSIISLKDIKFCSKCFNMVSPTARPVGALYENPGVVNRTTNQVNPLNPVVNLCDICLDDSRDKTIICVVEQTEDMWRIEKTGAYKGLYHILHGVVSPLDGKGPEDIKLKELVLRVKEDKPNEVILSTNPTVEGDNTALYIQKELKPLGVKVTRLGRGVPAGSNIEYLNKAILVDAIRERKEQVY